MMKLNNITYNRFLLSLLFFVSFVFLYLIGATYATSIILFALTLSINVLLIYKAIRTKNNVLTLIFVFIFLYVNVTKYGLLYGSQLSIYMSFNNIDNLYSSTLLLLLFLLSIWVSLTLKQRAVSSLGAVYYISLPSSVLFYINYLLAFIFFVIGKSGDTILDSAYAQGDSSSSVLYEYFFIPFVACLFFSKKNKKQLVMIYLLSLLYASKSILYGGRIEVLMLLISLFTWRFQYKLKTASILILLGCGLIGMLFLSQLRGGFYETLNSFEIEQLFESDNNVIISQEGDVTYASMRLIGMIKSGFITLFDRIMALFFFIVSIVVPYDILPPIANLSSYMSNVYPVGGGGLISTFFYVYLSYGGVVLIGVFIGKLFSITSNSYHTKGKFIHFYVFFVLVTMPRWFAYNPISLFKMALYGAIYILLLKIMFVDKSIN